MKGNNGTGNTVDRDDWETPQWLWDKLNEQYHFTIDCCSSEENAKCYGRCDDFTLHFGDSRYTYWMNPPFSKAKEMFKHFIKIDARGVCIFRCDNLETEVWQFILEHASWVHFIKGRINYEGHEGKGARFPSALIGFGVREPENIEGQTLIK